jgi:5-(carboxyamino)imidazole ribonucleotide mutase
MSRVAIVYGSPSDAKVMSAAGDLLDGFQVPYEQVSISAHRAPRVLVEWLAGLPARDVAVVIAGAGLSAALPGVVAAHTTLPVIGVPIRGGALDGIDALLAIAQMPPGVPVGCVGLDNARNAALLAVQILATADPRLRDRLAAYKGELEQAARDGLGR